MRPRGHIAGAHSGDPVPRPTSPDQYLPRHLRGCTSQVTRHWRPLEGSRPTRDTRTCLVTPQVRTGTVLPPLHKPRPFLSSCAGNLRADWSTQGAVQVHLSIQVYFALRIRFSVPRLLPVRCDVFRAVLLQWEMKNCAHVLLRLMFSLRCAKFSS